MNVTLLPEKVVIGVDFDGCITDNPQMGKDMNLREGSKETLEELKEMGNIKLVLWTCRTGEVYKDAIEFLKKVDMYHLFDAFNEQLPEVKEKYAPDVARKLGADIYIDDKNLGAVMDWKVIRKQVMERIDMYNLGGANVGKHS